MRILKKELWPYKVTVDNYNNDLETWLGDNMGAFKNRWNAVYNHDRSDYYFRTQEDAVLFSLKWV
jgi:hypothetical protein